MLDPSVRLEPEVGRCKPIAENHIMPKQDGEVPQASRERKPGSCKPSIFECKEGSRPPNPRLQREQRKLELCTNELYWEGWVTALNVPLQLQAGLPRREACKTSDVSAQRNEISSDGPMDSWKEPSDFGGFFFQWNVSRGGNLRLTFHDCRLDTPCQGCRQIGSCIT